MKQIIIIFLVTFTIYAKSLSVQLLNDELYDTDEQLTGGFKILYQENDNWSFHVGQDIYTPTDTKTLSPTDGDRPYNAWLYFGATYQVEASSFDTLFSFALDLGSRGPRALGKEVQNGLHDLVRATSAKGWDSQTENEYGNIFTLTAEYPLDDLLLDKSIELAHISVYASTKTGTIYRNYNAGISVAFGYNTPYYSTQISFPEDDTFYVFGNIQATHVAKNNFLEGNSDYNVIRDKNLRRYDVGLAMGVENILLRFTATTMSKEFSTQAKAHRFGVIEIIVGF